jgi:integrase
LIAGVSEPLRTILLIGIYAGLRIKSEALTLDWSDLDFQRVQAVNAKNGEIRTIPMNTVLHDALKGLRGTSDGSGRVFRSRGGDHSEASARNLQPPVEMLS